MKAKKEKAARKNLSRDSNLRKVREGVDAWNTWAEALSSQNLDWRADLRDANLEGLDLRGALLRRAILSGANLKGAKLVEAQLRGAKFRNADLQGADLSGSNLRRANFEGANLLDADLSGASLLSVNLAGAVLEGTNFRDAILGNTFFVATNLAGAKGLKKAKHSTPSHVSIDTLVQSQGKLPDAFLRGVGLSPRMQSIIHGARSLREVAFEQWMNEGGSTRIATCFISYSKKDREFVQRLRDQLNEIGVDYWYDDERLKGGQNISDSVVQAIEDRDKTILVLSNNSIASEWVTVEIKQAFKEEERRKNVVLVAVKIDAEIDAASPVLVKIEKTKIVDFSKAIDDPEKFKKPFTELTRALSSAS
ncbi:MAG TPA: toll/interleukin-1 receptor domain-containing protein [Isosphaeraceae bacterium]|nr:toll/interleukin-1 receptor domain-containing protein [Isosphaeraceae bacterium]